MKKLTNINRNFCDPVDSDFCLSAKALSRKFFMRDTVTVAKELLGKVLVTVVDGVIAAGSIVEVEAYLASGDAASHSAAGITKRNQMMFADGGHSYVYLSYGMHFCINVVTGQKGHGEAVLLRAIEPVYNADAMAKRRACQRTKNGQWPVTLCNGPGKLCQALGISLIHNGQTFDQTGFKIVEGPEIITKSAVKCSGRIGISKAQHLPLRFFLASSPFVGRGP